MKRIRPMTIALIAIIGMITIACSDEESIEPNTKPTEEEKTLGYWVEYKSSEGYTMWICPSIIICMDADESLEAFLEKHGEHLKLRNAEETPDGKLIYHFDCDLGNSDEVLDMNTAIHSYPGVKWCEPNRLAPVIYA